MSTIQNWKLSVDESGISGLEISKNLITKNNMNNIDMIKARIRDLKNKLERLYNGEIRLKSGKPVKNPEGFFWIWTSELNELNDFILKTL